MRDLAKRRRHGERAEHFAQHDYSPVLLVRFAVAEAGIRQRRGRTVAIFHCADKSSAYLQS
jgi:hypothetical protein